MYRRARKSSDLAHLLDGFDCTLFREGGRGELGPLFRGSARGLRHYVDNRRDEIERRSDIRAIFEGKFPGD